MDQIEESPLGWRLRDSRPKAIISWLVLTKDESCGRGEYREKFDVLAETESLAARIAKTLLATADYSDDLRVARVKRQGPYSSEKNGAI